MRAQRRAARPATCWSAPAGRSTSPRWTLTRAARGAHRGEPRRASGAAHGRWSRTCAIRRRSADEAPLRAHPGRRTLLLDRRHPAPPGHQAAAPRHGHRGAFASRAAGDPAHRAFALLAPGGRLVYSTCSLLPAGERSRWWRRLLSAETPSLRAAAMPAAPALAPGGARAGLRGAAPARSRGGDRRLLLCLSRKDNGRNLSTCRRRPPCYAAIQQGSG